MELCTVGATQSALCVHYCASHLNHIPGSDTAGEGEVGFDSSAGEGEVGFDSAQRTLFSLFLHP